MTASLTGALVLVRMLAAAPAAPAEDEEETFEASPQATGRLVRLRISYTDIDAGGDASRVLGRLNLPYGSSISLPKPYQLLFRIDVRTRSVHSGNTNAAGLEDVQILNLGGRRFSSLTLDGGFGMVVPTATDDSLGRGKLQLGPALALMFLGIPGVRLGFLAQNFFSVAGDADRAGVNRLTFQPLLSYRFSEEVFISSDPVMEFDWHAGQNTIPVNFHVGYRFGPHLSISLGPEWVITGNGENDITVNLTIDYENW